MSGQSLGSRAIMGRIYLRIEEGMLGWVDRLSFLIMSDQESEEHKWLGMTPQLRQWIGGREAHGLRDQGIIIQNLPYEGTIEIPLPWIERDKTGQIMARINGLAARANSHGAKLLSTLMINGESTVCYDGQFFFDTDHSEGDSGSQSNDLSVDISALPASQHGSVTAPAPEEMQQVILQAIQAILGFKDDQGEPINEGASEFLVMVPVPLWQAAVTAIRVPQLSSGQTNVLANIDGFTLGLAVNPRLTWTDKIAAFRVNQDDGVAAFIRQEEKPLSVSSKAEGSEYEFDNNAWQFGVDYRGAFGYGFWQHACLATMI